MIQELRGASGIYTERLRTLIQAKVHGEIVAPPEIEKPHVVNLMDALSESVARAKGETKGAVKHRPAERPSKKPARERPASRAG